MQTPEKIDDSMWARKGEGLTRTGFVLPSRKNCLKKESRDIDKLDW